MWNCYYCKKQVAPRALVCPHCGGDLNSSWKRGRMRGEQDRKRGGDDDIVMQIFGLLVLSSIAVGVFFLLF